MNKSILLAICLSWIGGFIFGYAYLNIDIRHNIVEGYHCTPVTTHTNLDSAKAQVRVYQAKVATIHGIGVE